jgi:hypothetical protein
VLAAITSSTASLLTVSGWGIVAICAALILVPYWRGKADLFTAWNFALVGCAIFIGVACLDAVDPRKLVFKVSFDFPDKAYKDTLLRSVFFFGCLLAFHYILPVGKKFASKRFGNSPPWSPLLLAFLLAFCAATAAAALFFQRSGGVVFLREAFMNLGHKAGIFAVALSFYAWYRNRTSPMALALFMAVFAAVVLYVMRVSHGRRLLLTVVFAPIAVMYWTNWRYRRPAKVIALGTLALVFVVGIGLWYQTFRFYDRGRQAQERTFANTWTAMKKVDFDAMAEQLDNWKSRLAQGVFPYAMLIQRMVDDNELEPRPLNTLQFMFAYPIPRRVWQEKPEPIGAVIVKKVLNLPQQTNWGLGVAGQGYYEGDWYALVIYALLLSLMIRLVDEPLKREPNNPFLIAVCAASSLFIVTWLRGDLGVHTVEILECYLFLLMLQFLGSLFAGSKRQAYQLEYGGVPAPFSKSYAPR